MPKNDYDNKRDKWPKRLVEILDVFESEFKRKLNCTVEQAREYAVIAVTGLSFYFGGIMLYIPRGDVLTRALKNKRMYDDWKSGVKEEDLAVRYDVSVLAVYAIIKKQRAIHRNAINITGNQTKHGNE